MQCFLSICLCKCIQRPPRRKHENYDISCRFLFLFAWIESPLYLLFGLKQKYVFGFCTMIKECPDKESCSSTAAEWKQVSCNMHEAVQVKNS